MSTSLTVPGIIQVGNPQTPQTNTFGVITLDGVQYIERPQVFAWKVTIEVAFQRLQNQAITLPGESNFLLKALTRDSVAQAPLVGTSVPIGSQDRRFQFRLNNAQGSSNYLTGGLGILNDPVVDTMCFGNGQFPYLLIPPIPFAANASMIFEVTDMGFGVPPMIPPPPPGDIYYFTYYPYDIHFAFQGSYLIPAAGQSFL